MTPKAVNSPVKSGWSDMRLEEIEPRLQAMAPPLPEGIRSRGAAGLEEASADALAPWRRRLETLGDPWLSLRSPRLGRTPSEGAA